MSLNIHIEKKDLWLIAAIGIFLVGVAYVIAYNPGGTGGNPAIMGHSADEIEGGPKARVYLNNGQNDLPSNAPGQPAIWTLVNLDSISYDPNNMANVTTNRITINEDGYYVITAQAWFINTADERLYYVGVQKNGNTFVSMAGAHVSAGSYNLPVLVADTIYLSAGDYVEFLVYPVNAGSTTDLAGRAGANEGEPRTYFAIHKIL